MKGMLRGLADAFSQGAGPRPVTKPWRCSSLKTVHGSLLRLSSFTRGRPSLSPPIY
jgi:hypothetical protein